MRRGFGRGLALPIAVALAIAACGGGGGSTPTQPPPPPPPPPTGLFFTVQSGGGANTLALEAEEMTPLAGPFRVRLAARDVEDLFGVSFDLSYPNDLLRFRAEGTEEGDFLSQGGTAETTLLVLRRPAGNLIVGLSRLGGEQGGVDGSGTLLRLEFAIRAEVEGEGDLMFTNPNALGADGKRLPGSEWLGASIEVVR